MAEQKHSHGSSTKLLIISLVFTTGYAAVELVGGLLANSLALIADAGHMITDSMSFGIGAFAARLSRFPASRRYTYGLARAEVLGALINVLFLLGVVVWIVIAAVQRMLDPQDVGGLTVMLVAFIGLLVNIAVAWILMRGEKNMNVRAALLHVFGDLAGSLAALAAGLVIYLTGWLPIDPLLSLFISVLIGIASINVLRDVVRVLMEGAPESIDIEEITKAMSSVPGVVETQHIHVWSLSSDRHALSAEIGIGEMEQWDNIRRQLQAVLNDRFGFAHSMLQPASASKDAAEIKAKSQE